jgi:hypothetical protein
MYQIIEASLMKDRLYIAPSEKESRFQLNLLTPNEAHAIPPAIIGVTGLVRMAQVTAPAVVPLIRSQITKIANSSGAKVFSRFAKFDKNSPNITDVIPKSVTTIAQAGGGSIKRSLIAGSTGGIVGTTLLTHANTLNEESHTPPEAYKPVTLEPIPDNEREGLICIFGGYPQRYKKLGDTIFCPSPREQINHPACKNSGYRPSFHCQSFGLSDSTSGLTSSSKLCVPLRNSRGSLDDLTVRCSEKFEKDFLPHVQAVSPEDFLAIQENLKLGIQALEQQKGAHELGILAYCQSNNSVNKGRQVNECSALLGLINKLKTLTPSSQEGSKTKTVTNTSVPAQADVAAENQKLNKNPRPTPLKQPSPAAKPVTSPAPALAPIQPGAAQ